MKRSSRAITQSNNRRRALRKVDAFTPRVLYYSHSAEVSGAEISLLMTISHMRGVIPVLVAPQGDLLDQAKRLGISVISTRSFRARMTRNPFVLLKGVVGTCLAGRELRRITREYAPDIVHANSIRAGLISLVGVLGRSTPLIWHVRDNLPTNIVGWAIRIVAARRVHRVFAISNAIRSNFANGNRLQGRTDVVHNGIDVNQPLGQSIRSALNTPDSRFVVGVVGQIAPWKRQHDAITAFASLHRKYPNSELWIVGEPKFREENVAYAEELRRMARNLGIADRVRFLGFRSDVMNIMASIDVLLIPSENEPFGRVVIEAMLAGKPVIGTRGGGIPEIVVHEQTGHLVELGDVHSMAKVLRRLYTHPSYAKELGINGRARVRKNFSIQSQTEQVRTQYRMLVARPSVRGVGREAQTYRFGSQ